MKGPEAWFFLSSLVVSEPHVMVGVGDGPELLTDDEASFNMLCITRGERMC